MKKILVTGASGLIGYVLSKKLCKYFHVFPTFLTHSISLENSQKLDITQKDDTENLFQKIKPDIVIHSAALANVDLCETNNCLANKINVKGTENIINACKKTNSKIIYVSTSFVFDGTKDIYTENDKTHPTTYYGKTKLLSEQIIKNSGLEFLILRTDQPYCWIKTWQRMNSVIRTIQTISQGKTLNEIHDWYNNPTFIPNFSDATLSLIKNNHTGIFHLTGSDYVNRYEWALLTAKIFNLDEKLIIPISSSTLDLAVSRKNIHLDNNKIFQKTGIHMMGIREGLEQMKLTNSGSF